MFRFWFSTAAKFLWKRIPDSVKTDHPELQKIWDVGAALWQRDFEKVYSSLDQEWSEGVSKIMSAVKGTIEPRP